MRFHLYGILFYTIASFGFILTQKISAFERELPPTNILAAARKIIPQTNSHYHIEGDLHCYLRRVGTEPPFWADSACLVHINQHIQFVDNHEELIPYLINSIIFKDWAITVPFSASAIKNNTPPYAIQEKVIVTLDLDQYEFCDFDDFNDFWIIFGNTNFLR